jgi:hypothetical protein
MLVVQGMGYSALSAFGVALMAGGAYVGATKLLVGATLEESEKRIVRVLPPGKEAGPLFWFAARSVY